MPRLIRLNADRGAEVDIKALRAAAGLAVPAPSTDGAGAVDKGPSMIAALLERFKPAAKAAGAPGKAWPSADAGTAHRGAVEAGGALMKLCAGGDT